VPAFAGAQALVGRRVLVPFGARGVTGLVVAESEAAPAEVSEVRDLEALLDAEPALSGELVDLCRWIAQYYEAPLGEVIRAALPAGTRVHAASHVELTDEGTRAIGAEGGALVRGTKEVLGKLAAAGGGIAIKELPTSARKRIDELVGAGLVR